jgi:chromate transporter
MDVTDGILFVVSLWLIATATSTVWPANLSSAVDVSSRSSALVLPSLILMIIIAKLFIQYMKTPTVQSIFTGLRPAVVGLLAAATLLLCNKENFSAPSEDLWQFCVSVALFIATFVGTKVYKVNPIHMIAMAGFAGLLLLY